MKKILSIFILQALLFSGRSGDDPKSENLSYFEPNVPTKIAAAFSLSVRSVGRTVTIPVQKGRSYQVLILTNPNRVNEKVVFNETVVGASSTLDIGIYFSWKYNIEDGLVEIDKEKHQVALQLNDDIRVETVEWTSEHLESVASRVFRPSEEEKAFMVLFHPNRMCPSDFETAVKGAMSDGTYGDLIAKIKTLPKNEGEQGSAGQPEKRSVSIDSPD